MKKKILLASILKPVNDTRMYEKFGISLAQTNKYEIHIAGFKIAGCGLLISDFKFEIKNPKSEIRNSKSEIPNIFFHPLFNFKRLTIKRFFAPWKFYILLLKLKPQLIILNTPELLIVTCLYQIIFGSKLYYDVQENYYRNIACTRIYPPIIRNLIAILVRSLEYVTRSFIDHYLLAERNYEQEFSFSKGKSTIIENKYKVPHPISPSLRLDRDVTPEGEGEKRVQVIKNRTKQQSINLLYSGTIAENYGIFEAVEVAKQLYKIDQKVTLTIIGYCALKKTLKRLVASVSGFNFIYLIGGDKLVPHTQIIEAIPKADFGLVSYQPNKSTENCIPTKIFEYMAHKLPMIVQYNPLTKVRSTKYELRKPKFETQSRVLGTKPEIQNHNWESFCRQYNAGIIIDYKHFDPKTLYSKMLTQKFYPEGIPQEVFWDSEEAKLIDLVQGIIS